MFENSFTIDQPRILMSTNKSPNVV